MRTLRLVSMVAVLASGLLCAAAASAGEHRLGFGFHYWKTMDEIRDDGVVGLGSIKEDGYSEIFSYQYVPSDFFKLEVDVEHFADGFGGSADTAYSPQVFLLVGRGIYAGVGAGLTYSSSFDGSWSDPYWAARAGWEWPLLPRLSVDITAHYRFGAWSELENVDTDTLTFGAIARITL